MNKKELLSYVKVKVGNTSIKLPRDVDFKENQQVITITMQNGIVKNMQNDSAAFEGWALCLKASLSDEAIKCCLKWDKPINPENPHYQRFLYRVDRFNSLFGGNKDWFFIHDESKKFLVDLKIKDGNKYFLNSPSTNDEYRLNDDTKNKENRLENEILKQQENLKDLTQLCPVELQRQLPVGLFHTAVRKNNAIFPVKHSAIDIWGAKKGLNLYLLELKATGNNKVGVLSELFFYTMVLRDEQLERFIRKSPEGDLIKSTKRIKTFILAPGLHPFINSKVFEILNEKLKNHKIEFGYIKYEEVNSKMKFNSFKRIY